ncbi:MAG: hypothetical protein SFW63_05755 [Alphaproteobacteria bacterium]|nr:hypothetical protein [Alphaproteobacteria bacterium]
MSKKPIASTALAAVLAGCSSAPETDSPVLPPQEAPISAPEVPRPMIQKKAEARIELSPVKRTVSPEAIQDMVQQIGSLAMEILWAQDLPQTEEVKDRQKQFLRQQEQLVERYQGMISYDRARVDAGLDAKRREWQNNPERTAISGDYVKILDGIQSSMKSAVSAASPSR